MPKLRPLALLALAALLSASACDNNAIGVDECRAIEEARCQAARSCGVGLDNDANEAECERFSRDNCLRGLPLADVPATSDVNACVAEIHAAGACATKSGAGHPAADCGLKGTPKAKASACDVVQNPEYSSECGFLIPPVATPAADAGKS